jgi:carbamate kinase
VIDKDRASALIASRLHADLFLISTDTDYVYLDYKKPTQRPLRETHVAELEQYLNEGHFAPGSMGPKIESVLRFLRQGGKQAIIASAETLQQAVAGQAGTHMYPDTRTPEPEPGKLIAFPVGGR